MSILSRAGTDALELVPREYFCYEYSIYSMSVLNNPNRRTSVSIPEDLKLELDRKRGDVSRSRFLLRILEKSHTGNLSTAEDTCKDGTKKCSKDSVENRTGILRSTESSTP
jgi:hypothetical protein